MKNILKILAFVLTFSTLTVSLTACGGDPTKEAQAVVEKEFETLKNPDDKTYEKYFGIDELSALGIKDEASQENFKKIFDEFVSNLDYSIVSSEKIDDENITVKVDITSLDIEMILQNFMAEFIVFSMSEEAASLSKEELNNKMLETLLEVISNPDLETVKNTVDIKVTKVDNKWVVEQNEELINSLVSAFGM